MSASTIVKLQLLKYPKLEDFNYQMEAVRQFKVVMLFLEEEWIRALDVADRRQIKLVDDMFAEEYIEALSSYLSVLEAPPLLLNLVPTACSNDDDPRSCSARLVLLEYALSQAIQYYYTDQKAFFNQASADVLLTNATKLQGAGGIAAESMDDGDGAQHATEEQEVASLANALTPLVQAFHMPPFPTGSALTAAHVFAAAREMDRRATHELAVLRYALQAAGKTGAGADANVDVDGKEKGGPKIHPREILAARKSAKTAPVIPNLTTEEALARLRELQSLCVGEDHVNNAIAALKLVHTGGLRQLQQRVNEVVALCQEFTANPVVDASLGHVGR